VTVYLVGAGPGDPGLLTRRGAELLARADVVVHDRLIDPSLLALAPAGAQLFDVGKRPGPGGAARQETINALLVEHGRAGRTVVRLKGGDPFLFGRGGEEAEALHDAGVAWEVVPGVTSALAVPAAAGIPVTHRGVATSVTVVTGHLGDPTAPGGVDWSALARAGGTLVILMGMATRAGIAQALMDAGRDRDTPVVVTEWGTTAGQRSRRTTLGDLHRVDLGSPAVIVVGPVAGLDLGGPPRPLQGRRVVVTRTAEQAGPLSDALRAAGAHVIGVPVQAVTGPEDPDALRAAAARAGTYHWVAFTSANAVERFVPLLRDGRDLAGVRLAAVGAATAEALARHHLVADLVADPPTAAGLAASFPDPPEGGGRVLFPRAAAAGPDLADGLAVRGWVVDDVTAYRTVAAGTPPEVVRRALQTADAITFASGQTVAAYTAQGLAVPPVVACIGPVTRAAAEAAGLTVTVTAAEPSADGLVTALAAVLGPAPR
jgi:uroporphyrinogen III methyltransferase/synthase